MVYEGGGGVEKVQKTVYVVYEWPLTQCADVNYFWKRQNNKKLSKIEELITILYLWGNHGAAK